MLESVKGVLLSIHIKFELSICLGCPTIEINISRIPLIIVIKEQQNSKYYLTSNAICTLLWGCFKNRRASASTFVFRLKLSNFTFRNHRALNFIKKCLTQTRTQTNRLREDSRLTTGVLKITKHEH